jgi:mannose-1-phosphate guanylyltransferase
MQALVLAGGRGTRLPPLTANIPKPVIPLCGRPALAFMLDWLGRHGVDDVILSCGHLADGVERVLGEDWNGIALRYLREDEPLGTAGPLRLALDEGLLDERLLMLNGDVLTDMDLTAEISQHERTGARTTLALIAVEDTSSYGVVPADSEGRVEAFLEKGAGEVPTNRINAGAYVLERGVAEMVEPGRAVSIEREVFPRLAGDGLYGFLAAGYWVDIGTPERYLEATYDLLADVIHSEIPARDETGSLVHDAAITAGAQIGPQAVVGRHCRVGDGAVVERAVLHDGVMVGDRAHLRECIVAAGATIEYAARLEPGAVVGANAIVDKGSVVPGDARVEPGTRWPS